MRVELDALYAAVPLRTMAPQPRAELRKALRKLADDPSGRSNQLDVKQLDVGGGLPVFRLRVGEWRATFMVGKNDLRVLRIFHRSEGYDWLGGLSAAIDEDIA